MGLSVASPQIVVSEPKVTSFDKEVDKEDGDMFDKKPKVDEAKARAQRILGKMIITLRKNQQFKLFVALDGVTDCYYKNDVLTLIVSDKNKYETLKQPQDFDILKNLLDTISSGTMLRLDFREVYTLDRESLVNYLKTEFGKIFVEKGDSENV